MRFRKKEKRTAAIVCMTLFFTFLAAMAVYFIRKYLLDKHDEPDGDEFIDDEDEFIDENGVCYTDEKNFVN